MIIFNILLKNSVLCPSPILQAIFPLILIGLRNFLSAQIMLI